MKSFSDFLKIDETVNPPKSEDEKRFMDKHVADKKDHPVAKDDQFVAKKPKAKRKADLDPGEDEEIYEAVETITCEDCGEEYEKGSKHECVDDDDDMDEGYGKKKSVKEAAQPKWSVSFKSKHPAQTVTARNTAEAIKKASARAKPHGAGEPIYKDIKRLAEEISEEEMTDAQMKKREEIVKSMKDKMGDFKKRYGDKAKDVMYATATKMAMKEEFDLMEAVKAGNMKLADGSKVKLSKEEAAAVSNLFSELNSANKKKMEARMMQNKSGFDEIVNFAKEAM